MVDARNKRGLFATFKINIYICSAVVEIADILLVKVFR